ncbi:monofunctional biosynthetic peptidoglycan transglycosylase [Polymorphobacter glacialis]|uniref:Biosynthetic peptidoglycan transglycosylase n=1 Tax=Sandarakinorhabdus glacialis TaxID=1614636 RepID=A0A916ZNH2_9SPHN|nr:monofunctional biosynthetic peptidoglycan transglycosylase [Polymorphobacter glacialis]GGE06029.1 monofunctional biosynthetic peptidoglycan transglycosylase [Polymorphobacter glacialis]
MLILLSVMWVVAYRFVPVPLTWPMARDAIEGRHVERDWVPLSAIAPAVPRAVIGAEDWRFCEHKGFDFEAMEQAAARNEKAKADGKTKLRGGSTISQQTAKNAFLWPGRSYVRKGLEAWFTVLIEAVWGKPRIMEVYLNIAEMGTGVYGVEAAAQHYFGVSAADLTTAQASRIAAILPQPIKRDAARPGRYVKRYARSIEKRARYIKREKIDACLR